MTQIDLFYYWPAIQWDFWVGLVAIVGTVCLNCGFAYKISFQLPDVLSQWGYGQASKDSSWAVLVTMARWASCYKFMTAVFALYYWYVISMRYSVWFLFCFETPFVACLLYTAFQEDEKNGLCSKASKENAKTSLKIYGTQATALLVAGTFLWLEVYNGTNYVKDAKHGLPEELTMMLGVVKNKFLKGH